ncbi:MAG: tetratricopeptide repeat protein [Myxococcales bacterium]
MFAALAIVGLLSATPDPHGEGKRLFERASGEYAAQQFADALTDFASAYRADPVPGFLFNLGQCHRQLGNWQLAADFYRRYLAARPDASNAATARELLAQVEGKAAQETELRNATVPRVEPTATVMPAPAAAVTAPRRQRSRAGPWALVAGGAAVGITGAVLGAVALDNGDRTSIAGGVTTHSLTLGQAQGANALATAGLVLGIAGIAAVAGGFGWLLFQ